MKLVYPLHFGLVKHHSLFEEEGDILYRAQLFSYVEFDSYFSLQLS